MKQDGPRDNPGQWLAYGLQQGDGAGEPKGELVQQVIDAASEAGRRPGVYAAAFDAWKARLEQLKQRSSAASTTMRCRDRLFHGLGESHVMETGVYLHPLYGLPMLRDASLKGLARAYAESLVNEKAEPHLAGEQVRWMFGDSNRSSSSGGNLVFHDGWWEPGSASANRETGPLVRETETPHHQVYYARQGRRPATDFDDPVPVAQLAVAGAFLLSVEGPKEPAELALAILARALQEWGFGGRVFADYGRFAPSSDP